MGNRGHGPTHPTVILGERWSSSSADLTAMSRIILRARHPVDDSPHRTLNADRIRRKASGATNPSTAKFAVSCINDAFPCTPYDRARLLRALVRLFGCSRQLPEGDGTPRQARVVHTEVHGRRGRVERVAWLLVVTRCPGRPCPRSVKCRSQRFDTPRAHRRLRLDEQSRPPGPVVAASGIGTCRCCSGRPRGHRLRCWSASSWPAAVASSRVRRSSACMYTKRSWAPTSLTTNRSFARPASKSRIWPPG